MEERRDSPLEEFHLQVLPGKWPAPEFYSLYSSAYNLWRSVWLDTFFELDSNRAVNADDFTRQDEVCTLCLGQKVIALSFLSRYDLRLKGHRHGSHFAVFPQSILNELIGIGESDVVVGSYFTVAPQWRGNFDKMKIKDILFALVVKRFLASGVNTMLGVMHRAKGMTRLGLNYGFQIVAQDLKHRNATVDIVRMFASDIGCQPSLESRNELVSRLWNNHMHRRNLAIFSNVNTQLLGKYDEYTQV